MKSKKQINKSVFFFNIRTVKNKLTYQNYFFKSKKQINISEFFLIQAYGDLRFFKCRKS